jgi:hypothetical protein
MVKSSFFGATDIGKTMNLPPVVIFFSISLNIRPVFPLEKTGILGELFKYIYYLHI